MSDPTPILQLAGVSRQFKKNGAIIPVLRDIDLSIHPLEFVCLVGESGCGKTTTGKILAGLLKPSAGRVFYRGQDVTSLRGDAYRQYRRDVQIIHQDPYASLNPTQTIGQILAFPLLRHHIAHSRRQARDQAIALLEQVDLKPAVDVIDKYPHQLSGGQRQRVSIARALSTNPSLIIADEAVSMVDVSIRIGLLQMLMDMRESLKVTIAFITHDLALAKYFAWEGRIAVMYLGRIVEIGRTPDVIAAPQHPYTRVLLSAIPEADPEKTRAKQHIPLRSEDIPRLTEMPTGCSFHPRCPWFVPGTCDTVVPELANAPATTSSAAVACTPLLRGEPLRLFDAAPADA